MPVTRIFVSYVPGDEVFYNRLVEQAKAAKAAVEFDRMQTKQPWVPEWKAQCRNRIYKCDGVIVLLSKNTNQGGNSWELECARTFAAPMLGIQTDKAKPGNVPNELLQWEVVDWNWMEIAKFIRSITKGTSASA